MYKLSSPLLSLSTDYVTSLLKCSSLHTFAFKRRMSAILRCRRYQASLLGFESFAAMSMETKMAGSVEKVKTMITSLLARGTLGLKHR